MRLVFVHGAGCTGDVFAAQVAAFDDALAPTLPGHGGDGAEPATIDAFADAVTRRLDELGSDEVVLCGHSMGGAIALQLALRDDSRVRGIVAIGSGARMRVAPAILEGMERDFPVAARTFARAFYARPDPERVDAAVEMLLGVGARQTIRDLRACDAFDATERLGGLRVPLLAITGAADVLTPPKFAAFLADRVPEGDARILDGTGHFAMVERPEEANAEIRAFVERLARR